MSKRSKNRQRPVIKLGGATVADAGSIRNTLSGIDWEENPLLVVSAPAGITDQLIDSHALEGRNRRQALRSVRSHFANIATNLISAGSVSDYLTALDHWLEQQALTASEHRLVARGELWNSILIATYLCEQGQSAYAVDARKFVLLERSDQDAVITDAITTCLAPQGIPVITGFIARDRLRRSTTLGRDGSDYTAALIAARIAASRVDFITSTRGIRSADPDLLGTDGLRIPVVDYAAAGTIAELGRGVLHPRTISPLQQSAVAARIFQPGQADCATHIVADASWPVLGLGIFTRTDGIHADQILLPTASPAIAERLAPALQHNLQHYPKLNALHCRAVNSQIQVSCPQPESNLSIRALHDALYGSRLHPNTDDTALPRINVLLYGPGKVGTAVLERLCQQKWLVRQQHDLDLRLRAVINSRQAWLLSENGQSHATDSQAVWQQLNNENPLDTDLTVVIDTTAAGEVAAMHHRWLCQGHAVITANKLSLSADDSAYLDLQSHPLYAASATVGAGLPIIATMQNLQQAGQTPSGFTAVLSGSINFLLDRMQQCSDYTAALKQAQLLGLVEPDPQADLSGLDIARKSIILARLLGDRLCTANVDCQPLPSGPLLEQHVIDARKQQRRLAYLTSWEPGKIKIRLESIAADNPLIVSGVNNAIRIDQGPDTDPLFITGPGAGINVTADAVYRDLLLTVTQALHSNRSPTAMAA